MTARTESVVSDVTRCLGQEGNVAENVPLPTIGGLLATLRKREMTVNPDVDGYTKALKHHQILQKTHKKLLKTKKILKLKYKPSGGPSFTFTVAGRR